MSFEKSSGVHIFLQKNGQKDDVLRIRLDQDGEGYIVSLTQRTVGNHSEVAMRYMSDVTRYMDKFIDFLQVDLLPYDYFQIDIPGLPVVKVDGYGMRKSRELLYDALYDLRHDWPHECFYGKH